VAKQPTLEIEASPEARYEVLAEVLATAKNSGMAKIGFVETM
jgi:biopolymer transport protein ExbD